MQQYLDGFNKKYPGIEVKYQSYSDYDNEVSKQIQYPGIEVKYQSYSDYDNEVSKQIQSGCCVYDGESSL